MKVKLDECGWAIRIEDFDIATATKHDADIIGCLLAYYTLVIFTNQNLTNAQEESFCKLLGTTADELYGEEFINKKNPLFEPGHPLTIRVTGEKDKDGNPGLFGFDEELGWHCNKIDKEDRRSIVWLHALRGSEGSETWFTNHIIAYNDMDDSLKEKLSNLRVVYTPNQRQKAFTTLRNTGFKDKTFGTETEETEFDENGDLKYKPSLIYTNQAGQTGVSISFNVVDRFDGLDQDESSLLRTTLTDFILKNDKYIYKHKWQDGDVLMSDQWLGVHKRLAFDGMNKRVLHRIETAYDKVDFTKLEEALSLVEK